MDGCSPAIQLGFSICEQNIYTDGLDFYLLPRLFEIFCSQRLSNLGLANDVADLLGNFCTEIVGSAVTGEIGAYG